MRFKSDKFQVKVVKGPAEDPLALKETYRTVACDFTDELEHFSVLKIDVEVYYWSESLKFEKETGVIIDVFTSNREEFIKMNTGKNIRLDKIFEIKSVG